MNHETIGNSGKITDTPLDIYERILPLGTDREMLVEYLDDVFFSYFLQLVEASSQYNESKEVNPTLTQFMDELCEDGLVNYSVEQVVDVILSENSKMVNSVSTLY